MQKTMVLILLAITSASEAGVTRVVIESKTIIDKDFGAIGQYELLKGHYDGELDPTDRRNRIITDIQFVASQRTRHGGILSDVRTREARGYEQGERRAVLRHAQSRQGPGEWRC